VPLRPTQYKILFRNLMKMSGVTRSLVSREKVCELKSATILLYSLPLP